jgi:hypothetical protein
MNALLALLLVLSLAACAESSLDIRSSEHDNDLPNRQNVPQANFNFGPPQPGVYGPVAPNGLYAPGLYGPAAVLDPYRRPPRPDCAPGPGMMYC